MGKRKPTCPMCGAAARLVGEHDFYYCPVCLIPTEGACPDPECAYCSTRPETTKEWLMVYDVMTS